MKASVTAMSISVATGTRTPPEPPISIRGLVMSSTIALQRGALSLLKSAPKNSKRNSNAIIERVVERYRKLSSPGSVLPAKDS